METQVDDPVAQPLQAIEIADRLDGGPGCLVGKPDANPSQSEEEPLRLADAAFIAPLDESLPPAFLQDELIHRRFTHVVHSVH